jgi:tRNA(Arg) A34 adenosine deaminase TadA
MQAEFLREAIELSLKNVDSGDGGPFGAVVVRGGEVIARGRNQVLRDNDPTAHAEVVAIRQACARLDAFSLEGCEICASCQPCSMCLSAIYWARIERIMFAADAGDAAAAGFDDAAFYEELAKPMKERAIPMTQALRGEAQRAFQLWLENPARVSC